MRRHREEQPKQSREQKVAVVDERPIGIIVILSLKR
jgi:hypothetical protein